MQQESQTIFAAIIAMRSLTAIHYKVEDALKAAIAADEREALQAMLNTNELDEVWAIAHERLGQHEKAAELRQWIAQKGARRGTANWTGFDSPSHHDMFGA